jgi:hypothetical protein
MHHPPTCSNCHFFQPEGHYHGSCTRLSSMVMGEWPGCRLGRAIFESSDEPEVVIVNDLDRQLQPKTSVEERSLIPC